MEPSDPDGMTESRGETDRKNSVCSSGPAC